MIRGILGLLAWSAAAPLAFADGNVHGDVLDGSVLRYRISTVTPDLAGQLAAVQPTNAISGFVLDLRFASGPDGVPAAATNYFSTNQTPLVILVNRQTDGAATALATSLRQAGLGIIIGGAGDTPPPDITITVSTGMEKSLLADPYQSLSNNPAANDLDTNILAGIADTNLWMSFVDHTSEADLVRKKVKDGEDEDSPVETPRPVAPPIIHDPALARAVDLLKALAALHPPHA